MHAELIARLVILIVVANSLPVLVARLLGKRFAMPLDGGIRLGDGQHLLGPSKTIRGVVSSVVGTSLLAPVIGLSWWEGCIMAALAMCGDLLSSFIKRRSGRAPSSRWTGIDQLPESCLPAAAGMILFSASFIDAVVAVLLFSAAQIIASPLLCRLTIRKHPY
jgi:CDP-2,3-bis-(O-geranylgeranyl)-sn-glycerol synthase